MTSSDNPLNGIRVVDLTQIYNGPYAAFLMAMGGADVIKVEPPGGERLRGHGGPKTSLAFAMLNSNKKSVTLNLKHIEGKKLLRELVKTADVLLENYAPGVMDRLGLSWDVLREDNPRLIYVTSTGYGISGQDSDLLAMDHTIQAASGIMNMTGDADRPPARAGGAPCDIMGGIHMYSGTITALMGRTKTGKGTRVEVSMLEAMYFTLCSELTTYHATGKMPKRNSARSPAGSVPYSRYECSDGGFIAIICVSERHWESILKVIGRDDLIGDANYSIVGDRREREQEVNTMIENWSRKLPRDEAFARMRAAKVAVGPVRDLEEVKTNPHMHERGMLKAMVHPEMGDITLPSSPIRYSEYDTPDTEFFPSVGEHNYEIFSDWLGLENQQIDELKQKGVI